MKKRTRRIISIFLLAVGMVGINWQAAYGVPIVSIDPSISSPGIGTTFELSVSISSVEDLYAYQFDIDFDPSILLVASVGEGAFLPGAGTTFFDSGTIDNVTGKVSFTIDTLLGAIPGLSGSGTLAVLEFQAAAEGVSVVSLSNVMLLDSGFTQITFATRSASISPSASPVPEPSAMILLALGLVGLCAFARKGRVSAD